MLRCCRAFLQPALFRKARQARGDIALLPGNLYDAAGQLWAGFLLQPMRFLEDLPTRPLTGWLGLGRASERAR